MPDLFLGLDIGTSGARAIVIDATGAIRAQGKAAMADFGENHRAPNIWWKACETATRSALAQVDARAVKAVSVDGTSGTVLAVDAELEPLGDGIMYNDACDDTKTLARIGAVAPTGSPAQGAQSALARAIRLQDLRPAKVLHQADWIASRFSTRAVTDENNALKTGYDLDGRRWPDWIKDAGLVPAVLPDVFEPGTQTGSVSNAAQHAFGLAPDTAVVAGTTDGCAGFVATGANQVGEGVTALGTTMTLKLLSDRAISAPEFGIYAHRILGHWLVGGASNTGGRVLLKFFDPERLTQLSKRIDPETDCLLDYYPLVEPGERFPIADPDLAPRLEPRPEEDAEFLKGLFDGIARIEAQAYARLQDLGAPALTSVRTVGGGAQNAVWTRLRARRLGVKMASAASSEAAYGSALLAMRGHA